MEPFKKQLQYVQGAYKTKRLLGLRNYALRIIDGLFLPLTALAQPIKIHITTIEGICGLKCRMCGVPRSAEKKEIDFEHFKNILDKLRYCIELKLTGSGETLLARDVFKIIEYAKRRYAHVSFYTSGLDLNETTRVELIKLGVDEIIFSLNAATTKLYEYIMLGATFKKVIGNIRALVNLKNQFGSHRPSIVLSFVAMKKNIHELPLFISLASELNVNRVVVHALSVNGSELGVQEEALSNDPLVAEHYIREAKKLAADKNISFSYPNFRMGKGKILNMCQEPWTKMMISIDGKVTPCCRVKTSFGNIFTESISKIWNGEKYRAFRKMVRESRLSCEHCYDMARKLGMR